MRLIHLPDAGTVLLDVVAWGLVHAGTGYLAHRLPLRFLREDRALWRERGWERGGAFYRRTLRIARWKDRLPEAGALFAGGVSKRQVPADDAGGLDRFVIETRRAETGHVLAMLPGPLFALWNPAGVAVAMVAYGVLVNLPFVAIQRYNRIRASRVLARARSRSARGTSGSSIP